MKTSALDPKDLKDYIRVHGPYMYHSTEYPAVPHILNDGLIPWEKVGSLYQGQRNEPRPNHSYIANKAYVRQYGPPILRVDLRKLDSDRLNPDEDHFDSNGMMSSWDRNEIEGHLSRHEIPDPPPISYDWEEDEHDTLGEWAADHLHHPELTRHSMNRGSLAVQSGVPPEAIEINPEWLKRADELIPRDPIGDSGIRQWHSDMFGEESTDHSLSTEWFANKFKEHYAPKPVKRVDPNQMQMAFSKQAAKPGNKFHTTLEQHLVLKGHAKKKKSNILDPIQQSLDPDVFDRPSKDNTKLKPRINKWVTKHIYNLLKYHGWRDPQKFFHLVLTGSLTSYQWSERSDFDVSLFPDYMRLPEVVRADLISLMITHLDGMKVPGTSHVLQCYVVPHDVTPDDLYKAGMRSAWDLDTSAWIVPPERDRVHDLYDDFPALITIAKLAEDKMRLLLKYDPASAKEYYEDIHKRRQRDMKAGSGDFTESNVIWKWLENNDAVPTIKV